MAAAESGSGRGSSLTAVRNWLTVAHPRQLRVMLIRSLTGPCRDDPDLIQRQPTLPQTRRAARKRLQPARDGGDRVRIGRGRAELPGHQRRHRACARHPAQLVAIHLGDDLHDAPINRVALTGQLRQLLKQHLKTLSRAHRRARGCGQRHNLIIAGGYDKSWRPIRAKASASSMANWDSRIHHHGHLRSLMRPTTVLDLSDPRRHVFIIGTATGDDAPHVIHDVTRPTAS